MKKTLILSIIITLLFSINGYSQKRKIPFFGKVKLTELCGSSDCRPSYGIKAYVHKKDKLYYNGNYNSILGRVITGSIFDTDASGIGNITKNDVDYFVEHNGSGSLEKNSKTEFDANVTANLTQILKNTIDLPEDLKAKLIAELDKTVTKNTQNEISFSFKIIQLKNTGEIDKQVSEAFSKLKKGQKLITGISVVTISGKWTSNTLREALDEFELNIGLNDVLSADAKLKYDKSKERVLEGEVKEFGFIIGDSYKLKK
jgi:hypothetical protein